ncbi:hypothetical protein D3C73_1313120 [compost metagenome]
MTLHRLIDVHRVAARRVEARQPHVANDHQLQRVFRILETHLQALFHLFAVQMRLQQWLIGSRARHHDLDGTLFGIVAVPLWSKGHDGVVQMGADVATHAHDHSLAIRHGDASLEVLDQVTCHLLQAWISAH